MLKSDGKSKSMRVFTMFILHWMQDSGRFQRLCEEFRREDLTYNNWHKKRRVINICLYNDFAVYANRSKNGEGELFRQCFSSDNFRLLTAEDREKHTLAQCTACTLDPFRERYYLFNKNKPVREQPQVQPRQQLNQQPPPPNLRQPPNQPEPPNLPQPPNQRLQQQEPRQATPIFTERFKELLQQTPELSQGDTCHEIGMSIEKAFNEHNKEFVHKTKLSDTLHIPKASTPDQVTSKAKRAILVEALKSVSEEAIDNDFYSLYSSEQSEREYNRSRLVATRDTSDRPSRAKSHTGLIDNYNYDYESMRAILVENQDDLDTLNWSQMSRDVRLRDGSGKWPKNGGQVCQIYLKHQSL